MFQQPAQNNRNQQGLLRRNFIAQQQTMPQPTVASPLITPRATIPNIPLSSPSTPMPAAVAPKKRTRQRIIAALLVLGLAGAIYCIWNPFSSPANTSTSSGVSQQNFSNTGTSVPTTGGIKVYVVGAVKNPGVYTLDARARVYDLLQAAGGTLPKANLVAINMAAKLNDGQEVYVTLIGEAPPTYVGGVPGPGAGTATTDGGNTSGQTVNINTAGVDEMSANLHISKKTAQTIIDYRTQHGDYSSVDQLAQVVSSSIYKKIKALCTV